MDFVTMIQANFHEHNNIVGCGMATTNIPMITRRLKTRQKKIINLKLNQVFKNSATRPSSRDKSTGK